MTEHAVTPLLQGVNLYLIGMMGAGKTTVGRQLAQLLGYQFFDTDALVEQLAGQAVADIFATAGEAEFRQLETQVLAELSSYRNLAIATGGGIVLNPMNWSYLRHGVVAWLDVSVEQLCDRLKDQTNRPLLLETNLSEKLQTLLNQRQNLYAQADVRVMVEPSHTPEQVAAQVLEAVAKIIKPPVQPPEPLEIRKN